MRATLLQPGLEEKRLFLLEKDPSVKGQQIWGTREKAYELSYSRPYSLSFIFQMMEDFFLFLKSVTEGQSIPT